MYESFLKPGPLDVIRIQNEDAAKLDERAETPHFRETEKFATTVKSIGEGFSFFGREVVAYGEVLQKVPSEPGGKPAGLKATGDIHIEKQGTYRGLRTIDARDAEDKPVKRVVHQLEIGTNEFDDEYGRRHTVTDYWYVCALHSSIFPLDPVNAHSNTELKDDRGTAALLEILLGEDDVKPFHMWRDLGWEMNQQLTKGDNGRRLNHQRVSLLNAINKFEGSIVSASDYIIGNPRAGDSLTNFSLSDTSEGEREIEIGEFAVFKNYRRSEGDKGGMIVTAKKELYVRGTLLPEGYVHVPVSPVLVAVKNVVSIV